MAASRGMLGSGNTDADSIRLANDYGSQKYGQYVAGLQPFMSTPQTAAGVASGQAGVSMGEGNAINSSDAAQGTLFNNANVGAGNATANADLAGLTQSGNIMNAVMQGAKLIMGGATGMPTGGGGGGSLASAAAGNGNLFPSASFLTNGMNWG